MRVSDNGIAFTANNEGFSAYFYDDNGHQAIGFGHDIQPGDIFNPPISRQDGMQLLSLDYFTRFEPILNALLPPDCTQNQYDALADFTYNEGGRALGVLLRHGWEQVPEQLPRWCYKHVHGIPVEDAGLLSRRKKEVELFQQV